MATSSRIRVPLRLAVYRQSVDLGATPLETHDLRFQNYITTDGQLASLSWFQTHVWGPEPDFCYCQTVAGLLCVAPSLPRAPRGRVCRLQLLMTSHNTVILGFESRAIHEHILLYQIRTSPTWRARSLYIYPAGRGWANYTPRHWVSYPSPLTTRRDAVEVFEPASTRGTRDFKSRFTLWPMVSRSACLGVKLHLGLKTILLLLSDRCGFVHVGRPSGFHVTILTDLRFSWLWLYITLYR
jgi:hypothetical protein